MNKTKVMVFERNEDVSLCDVKMNDVSVEQVFIWQYVNKRW